MTFSYPPSNRPQSAYVGLPPSRFSLVQMKKSKKSFLRTNATATSYSNVQMNTVNSNSVLPKTIKVNEKATCQNKHELIPFNQYENYEMKCSNCEQQIQFNDRYEVLYAFSCGSEHCNFSLCQNCNMCNNSHVLIFTNQFPAKCIEEYGNELDCTCQKCHKEIMSKE